jgi:hypothetical protein
MKSNNEKSNNQLNNTKQDLQTNPEHLQVEKNVTAQKDGFRYDYNDSSDFNDDKMS